MARKIALAMIVMFVAAGAPGWAQTPGTSVPPGVDRPGNVTPGELGPVGMDAYGTTNYTAWVMPPSGFHPYNDALGYIFWAGGYIGPQTGDTYRFFEAPVFLPTGATLSNVRVFVYDDDSSAYVWAYFGFLECDGTAACTTTTVGVEQTDSAGTPGYTVLTIPPNNMIWQNANQANSTINYGVLRVYFGDDTSDLRLGPVVIWYQRQVSPGPAAATFNDVPTGHWAFNFVEALASSGITAGCGNGDYCPDDFITRAQMAVYLSAALGLDYPDWR